MWRPEEGACEQPDIGMETQGSFAGPAHALRPGPSLAPHRCVSLR